jgi:TonB family protein
MRSRYLINNGVTGSGDSRRLPLFLLLALALHLGILALMPKRHVSITRPLGELSLSFAASAAESKSAKALPEKKRAAIELSTVGKPVTNRYQSIQTDSRTGVADDSDRYNKTMVQRQRLDDGDTHTIRQQLLGQIETRLSRYLVYPPLARQRGWQGEVRLAVDVNPVGELANIQIAQSSGHRLLDLSAKQALTQVRRVVLAADWRGRVYTNMMVPIRYQLNSP